MTDEQVKGIVDELKTLSDADKQFMLGYAAGVIASANRDKDEKEDGK